MVDNILITMIKTIFVNICIAFIFNKNVNESLEKKQKINIFILNMIVALSYAIVYEKILANINVSLTNVVCYNVYGFLFLITIKGYSQKNIFLIMLSITMTYISKFFSAIINFLISNAFNLNFLLSGIIEQIILGTLEFTLLYLFFKINRFKNGFSFLKNSRIISLMMGITMNIILIISFIYIGMNEKDIVVDTICTIGIIIGGILMFYWIKKSITKYYKEKMKERTVEIQQEQIKEKDETIKNLKTELATVLQINHKYSQRISAMEKAVSKLAPTLQTNEEYAEEYGDILSYINELSKEYKEEVALTIKENKLPKTNVFSIDNLLEYMKQEAEKEKIDFDLELKYNINEIIENKIAKNKLETILTDHIRDAIIAIKSSENKNRKIKVILNKDENYQIEFYDTGIEFEIDTLLKLGLERTTTHKATGGTGIGFVTTFETLKECKASLIIEEFNNKQYTKAIIIKFDNKNEYKIHSYRAEEIKNKTKNNRIKIYKIN